VVEQIQGQDGRIRYIQLPTNFGIGYVRHKGVKLARGRYLALADSDDLWLPGKLRKQVEVLERYPLIDILFSDWWSIDHVRKVRNRVFEGNPGLRMVKVRPLDDSLFLIEGNLDTGILRSNFIATPTMVIRKEALSLVGNFLPSLKSPVDLEFCWRAAVLGARFAYLDQPLIERHVYKDSLSVQGDQPYIQRLDAVEVMYQTCRKLGRRKLLQHVRATEVRTYCNLLRIYGEQGQRCRALWAYLSCLRRGLSLRATKWFLLALVGFRILFKSFRFSP